MRQSNRWHPCLLLDNYQGKMRQILAEADGAADSGTRLELEPKEWEDEDE